MTELSRRPLPRPTACRLGGGFTLIELLVVIAIIAVLAAILFPVFARAGSWLARSSVSPTSARYHRPDMYAQDCDETYPQGFNFNQDAHLGRQDRALPEERHVLVCPSQSRIGRAAMAWATACTPGSWAH